jgi:hypothetical protein
MQLLKRPWFLILLIVAGVYTYQFYKRVEVSTSSALATPVEGALEKTPDEAVGSVPVRVKTSQTFSTQGLHSFQLKTDQNMALKFVPSDGDQLIVSLLGEGSGYKGQGTQLQDWFHVKVRRGTLSITGFEHQEYKNFNSLKELSRLIKDDAGTKQLTMIVEVPENMRFRDIELQTVLTNVETDGLRFSAFSMATVTGHLVIKNSEGERIKVESVSGDIQAKIKGLQQAKIASVSGNARIVSPESNPAVDFSSVSGDLNLQIPKDSEVDVSFNSMTGELLNDFGNTANADHKLKFSSLSGSATINKVKIGEPH